MYEWQAEFVGVARKAVYGLIVVGALGGVTAFLTGKWENVVALWNLPAAVQSNSEAIRKLRLPKRFFELSPRSGPILGHCVDGAPCAIRLRLRRFEAALDCELVPTTLRYFYRNPRTNEVHDVEVLSGRGRDVGTSWVNMDFTFSTPAGLSPDSELCTDPRYIGCPGQLPEDGEIGQPAECISILIQRV